MTEIIYIFKILLYFLLVYCTYRTAKRSYARKKKLSWISILVCSLLFGYYSILIGNPDLISDRGNYAGEYVDVYWDVSETESVGLNFVYNLLRPISLNPNFLFFVVYTVYIALTLIVYRYYKSAQPRALLFLLCSLYPIFGFYAFKQCIANVLILIATILYFNMEAGHRFFGRKVIVWIFITTFLFGAILFHEAALLAPLVFVLFLFWKNKIVRVLGYVAIFAGIFAFSTILNSFLASVGNFSEALAEQTAAYDEGLGFTSNILTGVKGLPFFIITFIAFRNRKLLYRKIKSYDKYLLLSLIVSSLQLCSIYNYWIFRLALFFYFPVMVFACLLRDAMLERGKSVRWFNWSFYLTLILSIKEITQLYFLYGGV